MAFADKLKGLFKQGESTVASHKKEAHDAVDKAAAAANKETGGKYSSQIDSAEKKADEAVDKLPEHGGHGEGEHAGNA